jgi:hypothetical protein
MSNVSDAWKERNAVEQARRNHEPAPSQAAERADASVSVPNVLCVVSGAKGLQTYDLEASDGRWKIRTIR